MGQRIRKRSGHPWLQRVLDMLFISCTWSGVLIFANITEAAVRSNVQSTILATVAVLVTVVAFERSGLYRGRPTLPRTEEISKVFFNTLGGTGALAVSAAFLDWMLGAWELILGSIVAFVVRTLSRGLLRTLATELPSRTTVERVVVIGAGQEAGELVDLIGDHPESRLEVIGILGNLNVAEQSGLASLWLGNPDNLIVLMQENEADTAIVTATGFRSEQFRQITTRLFSNGYDVLLTTGISRLWEGRFEVRSLSHEPLILMSSPDISRWGLGAKRLIDIVGASIALVLATPIMLMAALAISIEDRGPVFYTAQRSGRGSEPFGMIKFRSMIADAEKLKQSLVEQNERNGPLFKLSHDPRITKVGKFLRDTSIDELPQLVNVIKGDMSLVGPRPALPEEEAVFDEELRQRTLVTPGITGLWQVEARSNAAFSAYKRLDLHYVENWTLGLDLRILLATVEQFAVSFALLPLRPLLKKSGVDSITPIVDIRFKPEPVPTSEVTTEAEPVLSKTN